MLELQNISYGVEQDGDSKNILRDISLTIDERFVAITGPNGGGKSTLAKVIAGILTPTQGRILLDGEDITGLDITQRAQKGISFAFQQPCPLQGPDGEGPDHPGSGQADRGCRRRAAICPRWGCVPRTTSTGRWTHLCPAESSSVSRSP